MAWPYLGPFPARGPIREDNPDLDRVGGHPTAQGALDRDENYPRLPRTQVSAKNNGVAGRPRYKSLADRHGKAGGSVDHTAAPYFVMKPDTAVTRPRSPGAARSASANATVEWSW